MQQQAADCCNSNSQYPSIQLGDHGTTVCHKQQTPYSKAWFLAGWRKGLRTQLAATNKKPAACRPNTEQPAQFNSCWGNGETGNNPPPTQQIQRPAMRRATIAYNKRKRRRRTSYTPATLARLS
jgi:hypothetical protein